MAGMGDLLALFRCISCRFAFGTDVARPTSLGAPGRVYTSSEVGLALCLRHCAVFRAVQASKPLPPGACTLARRWESVCVRVVC